MDKRQEEILQYKESFKYRSRITRSFFRENAKNIETLRNEELLSNQKLAAKIKLCEAFNYGIYQLCESFELFVQKVIDHDIQDRFASNDIVRRKYKVMEWLEFLGEHSVSIKLTLIKDESPYTAIVLVEYSLLMLDLAVKYIKKFLSIDLYNTIFRDKLVEIRERIEKTIDIDKLKKIQDFKTINQIKNREEDLAKNKNIQDQSTDWAY